MDTLRRSTTLFLFFITVLLFIIMLNRGVTLAEILMYAIAVILGILLIISLHSIESQKHNSLP